METVLGLDEGPVVSMDAIALTPDSDTADVETEALRVGVPALVRAIVAAADGSLAATPQVADGVTYAQKLSREDRLIDPSAHAVALTANRIRGLRPHIGALLALDDETFTIWRATPTADAVATGAVFVDGERLLVGLADGAIEITELQTAGKRALAVSEWLRGRRTPPTRATRPA
jgi:methionyl-tRNA formyltransferase